MSKFKKTRFQSFMEIASKIFLFPVIIVGFILKFYDKVVKLLKKKKTHHLSDDEFRDFNI